MSQPSILCHHIRRNGRVCQSPALRGTDFCYYHYRLGKRKSSILTSAQREAFPIPEPNRPSAELALNLEAIVDADSLRQAVSKLVVALAARSISPERGTAILYGLQLAANSIRR